ncbi:MAG TPA: 6-phosphogluconolactonase [Terriglobia bacterium]|nr:6-phosphogluconolactonase [Terriglobia bacterium]
MALNREIRVFRDLGELSRRAAERFLQAAQESVAARQFFSAALSGGSTPRSLFQLLAEHEFSWRIPWAATHLFQVDERTVPPDHPESNYKMIREALLEHTPLPAGHFHRMKAEPPNLGEAAAEYAREIAASLRPPPAGWPRFDLVLLGMGPDGHTASLFPGTAALDERSAWVTPNHVPQLNTWRLTLTYPVLNAAREVIFFVAGEDKAGTLRRVLHPESPADSFPCQGVIPSDGPLRWYLDQAAAKLLPEGVP